MVHVSILNLDGAMSENYICYAERKTASWIISTRQDIYNRRTSLFTRSARIYDSSNVGMGAPWHIYGSNRMDDDNGVAANRCNVLNLKNDKSPSRKGLGSGSPDFRP